MSTTINNDVGSLFVGQSLPVECQHQGVPEKTILLQLAGEAAPRKVTYVMGSVKKGWHLCCKGQGKFAEGQVEFTLSVK